MTKRNSGNPNPVITPEFEARKIPKLKGIDLAKRPLSIRFSVQTDAILREMPNHQQFVRDAVDAAIARHLGTLPSELRADDGESKPDQPGAD